MSTELLVEMLKGDPEMLVALEGQEGLESQFHLDIPWVLEVQEALDYRIK